MFVQKIFNFCLAFRQSIEKDLKETHDKITVSGAKGRICDGICVADKIFGEAI